MRKKFEHYRNVLKANSFWSTMVRNIITIFSGNGFASILNMITTVVILWILNPNQYGELVIAMTYMNLIDALFNFQSWQGVIRYGTFAITSKNVEKACSVFKSGFTLDILTCIIGFLVGVIAVKPVAYIMGWSPLVQKLCYIFCIEIVFHIEGTITGILRLFDKFRYVAIHSVLTAAIKLGVIFITFVLGIEDIVLFTIIYVISDILKYLIYLVIVSLVLKNEYSIKQIFLAKYKDTGKEFWHFTLWSNLAATADVPIKYFDIFFLSLISTEIVAAYNVFKKAMAVFSMVITPISQAILPQLSQLIAEKREEEAYIRVMKLSKVIFGAGLPIMVISAMIAPLLLKYMGLTTYTENIYVLYWLMGFNLCAFSFTSLHPLFSAYGFSKESTFITLGANIIYTIWCLIFINFIGVYAIIMGQIIQLFTVVLLKTGVIKSKIFIKGNKDV